MKRLTLALGVIVMSGLLSGCSLCSVFCDMPRKPAPPVFAGRVLSNAGSPIDEARVEINSQTTATDRQGYFKLRIAPSERYLLTIRKKGFAPLSKIYQKDVEGKTWVLTQATVVTVDPTKPIFVRDVFSQTACIGSRLPRNGWEQLEIIGPPLSNMNKDAMNFAYKLDDCSPGVMIAIPAGALVDIDGQLPTGAVEVSVATVDIFSPDAMPGDFSVLLPRQNGKEGDSRTYKDDRERLVNQRELTRSGFMQTFGAGFITISSGEKTLQLKPGMKAKLTIPIDPTELKELKRLNSPPKDSVPLLLYDEGRGVWLEEGTALINSEKDAYEAEVTHFSTYNMDVVFQEQSCVQFDSRLINGSYHLRLVMPAIPFNPPTLPPHEFDISNGMPSCGLTDSFECYVHAAWNLPSVNQYPDLSQQANQVGFIPSKSGIDIANFRVNLGQKHGSIALPPNFNTGSHGYPACSGVTTGAKVILTDKPSLGLSLTPTQAGAQVALSFPGVYWGPSLSIVPSHSNDGVRIQWCTVIGAELCDVNSSGWQVFGSSGGPVNGIVPGGRGASSYMFNTSQISTAGVYKFRIKAHVGDPSFGASGVDTASSDPVEVRVTKLTILNNIVLAITSNPTSYGKIVRMRTDKTNPALPTAERLSPDGCFPGPVQGDEFTGSRTFDVTFMKWNSVSQTWNEPYMVHVGLGYWVNGSTNAPNCPSNWAKRFYIEQSAVDPTRHYRSFQFSVPDGNQTAGTGITLTITGNAGPDQGATISGSGITKTISDVGTNPIADGAGG